MTFDPKLLQDCREGDRSAQFKLYKNCFQVLMGISMRYKSDETEAAAMVNAGFLKILTNLDQFEGQGSFESWIRRIMVNTLIDEFRKNRKVKELIEYTDFSEAAPYSEPIDYNEADKQFDAEQLQGLIAELPPMSRKVFNLYAIDGFSHKEIGAMLGISDGTSKWHLSSARKKLIEMMKKMMNSSKAV